MAGTSPAMTEWRSRCLIAELFRPARARRGCGPDRTSCRGRLARCFLVSTRITLRISTWSATALTGRLSCSSTSTLIFALWDSSAPRQRRGRNGLIGVSASSCALIGRIGPCAERLYAVEPAGVATSTPSQTSSSSRTVPSTEILSLAAWKVCAEQRDFVDRQRLMRSAGDVVGHQRQRVHGADLGPFQALDQAVLTVLVHQEADRSAVHAVDGDVIVEVAMQRLEHQAVASECHDGIGLLRRRRCRSCAMRSARAAACLGSRRQRRRSCGNVA